MLEGLALNTFSYYVGAKFLNMGKERADQKDNPAALALYSAVNTVVQEVVVATSRFAIYTFANCYNGNCFNGYADVHQSGLPLDLNKDVHGMLIFATRTLAIISAIKLAKEVCQWTLPVTGKQIFLYGTLYHLGTEVLQLPHR